MRRRQSWRRCDQLARTYWARFLVLTVSDAHIGNDARKQAVNANDLLWDAGALPAQYFQVKVSSTAESLAQLMYSVLLTGYLFRNAFYRMQLRNSLASGEAYGTGTTYVAG